MVRQPPGEQIAIHAVRAVATRNWPRLAACHPEVQLPDRDNSPLLLRLLTVTSASRDAFAEAAYVVRSPRLAALFVRRAQHQARIAAFLSEHLTPGSVPVADPVLAKTRGPAEDAESALSDVVTEAFCDDDDARADDELRR